LKEIIFFWKTLSSWKVEVLAIRHFFLLQLISPTSNHRQGIELNCSRPSSQGQCFIPLLKVMKTTHRETSKKDRLYTGPYHLPKLQEVIVSVATAINGATCCTKSKIKTKTLPWLCHLLNLNIDTHGSNLLSDYYFHFLPYLALIFFKYVAHSLP